MTIFSHPLRSAFVAVLLVGASIMPAFASAASMTASFDTDTLTTEREKPTLTGEADGVKSVRVSIETESGKRLYRSGTIKVKNGAWHVRVSKKLKDGTYTAIITDGKKSSHELASATLVVGDEPATGGLLGVSMLPLLVGGAATVNGNVPVAYLKLSNPSDATTTISSVTLLQRGTASADTAITGIMTSDDKGGSRSTIGGTLGATVFSKGSATIPLAATIAPGQTRIFTLKAMLAPTVRAQAGKSLMLDVSAIASNASRTSVFPIRGTTWVLY